MSDASKYFIKQLEADGVGLNVIKEALNYPINAYRELLDCNNCYSYGVGDLFLHANSICELEKHGYIPWIGERSGVRRPVWNLHTMAYDVSDYLAEDGAYFVSNDKPAMPVPGFNQIFVASDIQGYGHVYHQNIDGLWSHKLGVRNWVSGYADRAGRYGLIENPAKSYRGEYTIPIGFFQIPLGTQIGIKSRENKLAAHNKSDSYLQATQDMRDRCKNLNIRARACEKVTNGFENNCFKLIYDDYQNIKRDFNKVCARYQDSFNRYGLLQVEYLRDNMQFIGY